MTDRYNNHINNIQKVLKRFGIYWYDVDDVGTIISDVKLTNKQKKELCEKYGFRGFL